MSDSPRPNYPSAKTFHPRSDWPFFSALGALGSTYIIMVLAMLLASAWYAFVIDRPAANAGPDAVAERVWANPISEALADPRIQYATWLSLFSATVTTILCLWVSVPIGYLMSRFEFRGKTFLDAILDIPIVIPPLVVGLCLLILFKFAPLRWIAPWVVFEIPSVILAQFMVACAFAVRTMRATFDQISRRQEQVALTLGCSRGEAFWAVVFPQTRRGLVAAATLAWSRSLGEFGPILMFASATRMRTEVLSSSVYLEMQAGRLSAALGVSLLMIVFAMIVLVIARSFGLRGAFH